MNSIFQYRRLTFRENEQGEPLMPYALINLEKNQVYCGKVDDVNDPFEGVHNYNISEDSKEPFMRLFYGHKYVDEMIIEEKFEEYLVNIKLDTVKAVLNTGLSCFSKHKDSILMWGHYADSHKGICVEFDKDYSIFQHLMRVDYFNEPYKIQVSNPTQVNETYFTDIGMRLITSKYIGWAYEGEYRFIGNVGDSFNYEPKSIKAIYFGSKTVENTICDVYHATKHLTHIRYYYMKLNFDSYKMKPDDITERCHKLHKIGKWEQEAVGTKFTAESYITHV